MAFLLETALANLIVAAFLALLAAFVGAWGRRPAVTHALWLLVLVKLVTPPFFQIGIPWPTTATGVDEPVALVNPEIDEVPLPVVPPAMPEIEVPADDAWPPFVVPEAPPQDVIVAVDPVILIEAPAVVIEQPAIVPAASWPWVEMVGGAWLIGSLVWLGLACIRLWRFQRMLRFAEPAPDDVQALACELADRLDVRCPEVRVVPASVSPMLWTLGRMPRLLVPAGLLERLTPDQRATLLAHELAHWRRRDDRVRWLEFVVLALYWWSPLVWWSRRELHQAEEECCDAWVVSILPDSAKAYALALVETVDFLSDAPADLPLVASGLGRVRLLKRRVTMILQGNTPRALTLTGMLGVAGVGLLLLPMVPGLAQSQPGDKEPGREKKFEKKAEKRFEIELEFGGDPKRAEQVERVREEIRRMQEDLEKRQQEMQRRAQELQKLIQEMRQAEKAGPPDFLKKKGPAGGPGGAGGAAGGLPDGKKGGPGFPGGPPGGFGGGPMEHRLAEVERKLDMLLQEVRALRGEMGKGGKAGPMNQKPNPNPNPNPGRVDPNAPPTPPARHFQPVPPVPPVPPRPPMPPARQDEGER